MFVSITYILIFCVGMIGNICLLVVLCRQNRSWPSTMTYLLQLTISDLLFVSTLPFWTVVNMNNNNWPFGLFMCKLVGTIPSFNMLSSVYFLTAIAVDRYIAVVHLNGSSRRLRSKQVVKIICGAIWVFSALLGISRTPFMILKPPEHYNDLLNLTASQPNSTFQEIFSNSSNIQCQFFLPPGPNKLNISGWLEFTKATVGFFIPVITISYSYTRIIITVKRKTMDSSSRTPVNRVTTLGSVVIFFFVLCWLPYNTVLLYSAFCGWWKLCGDFEDGFVSNLFAISNCIAWSNCIMNPILYAFTTPSLRKNFFELCTSRKKTKKPKKSNGKVLKMTALEGKENETETITISSQNQNTFSKCCINKNLEPQPVVAEVYTVKAIKKSPATGV